MDVTASSTEKGLFLRKPWLPVFFVTVFLPAALYVAYRQNPTLSHNVTEMFSVVVAFGIFMLTWNARSFIDNHYFLVLGIAYFFVGAIDYLHCVSFEGVFSREHHSNSIELWFAARFLQSFAFLAAPMFVSRKIRPALVLVVFTAAALALVGLVYYGVLPDYYIPGKGLTRYKVVSDHLVSFLMLLSIGALWAVREKFDPGVFRLLVLSILFSIASEMSADLYTDAYVYNSVFGHYLKVVSFYLIYKAVIATGLIRPYDLLFRNLKRSEEELRASRDGLESRVAERTTELREANLRLEEDLAERRRANEMRELILDLLQRTDSIYTIPEFLSVLTSFLQDRLECDAVAVRYRRGNDYPYVETRGFPQEFVQAEMSLCSAEPGGSGECSGDGETVYACTCGAVIAGRFDPSLPFFRPGGMFWTNSASELLAGSEAFKSIATRGRCVRQGYESIALVPLRVGGQTLGLLQINDRRKGLFDPHFLARIERVAENVAGVLARLLTQEAHRESEDRFRSLVEQSSIGTLIYQRNRIVYKNPHLERLFGALPETALFRLLGPVHPEDAGKFERLCDAMEQPGAARLDVDIRFHLPDGETARKKVRWLKIQADPINFHGRASLLVGMVDITRIKELEHIVTIREKLASLGQVAAGIAHEIRNPLSGININVSTLGILCRRSEGLDPADMGKIDEVIARTKAASDKISSVIKGVMDFCRPVPPKMDRIDLNRVVREAVALSKVMARKSKVEILEIPSSDPLVCRGDPALMEQVVLNLFTNANQAMQGLGRPGRITVTLAREGRLAVVRVADTGPGVPEHLREMVFEPFFSTRPEGHGIGLSISRRIVADHGGLLAVGPSESGGAEFRIELPLEAERSTA